MSNLKNALLVIPEVLGRAHRAYRDSLNLLGYRVGTPFGLHSWWLNFWLMFCNVVRVLGGARDACLGEACEVQTPVSWLRGAALGARAPSAEFEPRQGGTALGARVPVAELGP